MFVGDSQYKFFPQDDERLPEPMEIHQASPKQKTEPPCSFLQCFVLGCQITKAGISFTFRLYLLLLGNPTPH